MAPLPGVISQLPSDRPIHWVTSVMEGSMLFLTGTHTLSIELPALHAVLLPKSAALQNPLPTIIVFHRVLLLMKELIVQQMKLAMGHTHGIH